MKERRAMGAFMSNSTSSAKPSRGGGGARVATEAVLLLLSGGLVDVAFCWDGDAAVWTMPVAVEWMGEARLGVSLVCACCCACWDDGWAALSG